MKKVENVLYTDGHDVIVTDSVLHVRKKWYNLSGITKHGFSILQPVRLPCVLLMLTGVLLCVAGGESLIPGGVMDFYGIPVTVSQMSIVLGIFLLLLGSWLLWWLGERYAVSITTAEGNKNVVISRKREYIAQIVHALNDAFFARLNPDGPEYKREFQVSHR